MSDQAPDVEHGVSQMSALWGTDGRTVGHRALQWTGPILVGVAVGALTAYGQGWLGGGLSSLANSAGPWSLAAFLVARSRRQIVAGAIAALLTLWCCELGYAIATIARGDSNATSTIVFWLGAGLFAGPPLGIAAVWSTHRGRRGAVGIAVLAGVFVGEGWYGWTTVADTTDWRYWALELFVGVVFLVWAVTKRRTIGDVAVAIGTTAIVAAVVFTAGRAA